MSSKNAALSKKVRVPKNLSLLKRIEKGGE
jgi:hypothetical protein